MISFVTFIASLLYSTDFLLFISASTLVLIGVVLPVVFLYLRAKYHHQKTKNRSTKLQVGLFHPYCNAGGGGEKVLWVALQALQRQYTNADFFIYTGDIDATPGEILAKVAKNLNVKLDKHVKFLYLTRRKWVEGGQYPCFTLLGQALGSIYLGFEALNQLVPDVYIDTTGFTFTLPLFKYLGRCKTGSYLHYPTITKKMMSRVSNRQALYNNRSLIARSPLFTHAKLLYYRLFAWLYSLSGQCSDTTLVNSTFTLEHLTELWNRPLHLVYPPCDVDHLKKLPRPKQRPRKIRILSLAQFRPEKDHPLQLQSLYELREIYPDFENVTLVMCGSCRNSEDSTRVADLKDLSKHLSLENNVEFKVNLTYEELLGEFQAAYLGIHTMMDEHFGISVVEQMAAGLIVVAHRSGGPLLDIIETSEGSRLGFLATTPEEYAHVIKYVLTGGEGEVGEIRERARASVDRFSCKKFKDEFLRAIDPLFK
ncbi:GDP-Man:Man(3)GlcNAc(2)-PP-Dol alpha-1,2-mannosyltransferase [Tribolium castaneum]|uniref:GDP-Man:Man(3)GlcNAc(2)-PP-Dol alpha-1,2-mannosyltransferase n=1 Tax=Tribolium castaneum TaxID=7070 RepID=D2A5X1_TRICA|nr:PREDICTED: GDP-Man:Man(3)GlcNAc(2)-PP-Dol alpha-1,2-mannosyltransferase [Tribolium castaneum]EFA05431.1 GDP-Man:Man(3)GlcNAc(2)-PP-Dol alpha-1,2-mannosyltransferase-like Protein [Tribolium castaneum]|eukprot:XP_969482.1 PREDICTED: GDP-Man:Man(3)GlcNAc(2)-PP-Dol alpha-1,2-mannosyltransferase [Tribolium castaneum]